MASSDWIPLRQAAAAVASIFLIGSIGAHLNGAPMWAVLTLFFGAVVLAPFAFFGPR